MFKVQKSCVASIVSAVVMCVGGLGCSGSSSPSSPSTTATTAAAPAASSSTTNGAPVINSVNVTPTWGITTLQEHAFTSGASDPDDDTLTYRWEDSTGALLSEAASFNHTFDNLPSTVTEEITLTVQDADGLSTSSSVTVTSISLTGTWVSNRGFPCCGSNFMYFYITQSHGGDLTGTWEIHELDDGTLGSATGEPGTITADGSVRIRAKFNTSSGSDFHLEADDDATGSMIDPTGTTITGVINGSGVNDYTVIFTKQ